MNSVYKVYFKSLVNTFYQRHAGMFLVFFILMFGLVPPHNLYSYHQKLLTAFVSDTILRIIVFMFWFLYSLKCIQFVLQQLEKKEHDFLFEINALSKQQRFFIAQTTLLLMLAPILVYATIAIFYSVYLSLLQTLIQIILFSFLLSIFSSFVVNYKIKYRNDVGISKWLSFLSIRFRKPYVVIVLMQVLNDFKIIFSVTKLLSIICIYIAFAFCDAGVYDIRVVMLGLLFSMLAHITLLFEIRKFEETQLLYVRNTSQSMFAKWVNYIILVSTLLLPELLILIKAVPEKILVEQLPTIILFCISMLTAFIASFLKLPFNKDKSIINPTYIVIVVFFLILYKMFALIIAALFLYSFLMLKKNYFRFELTEEK